MWNSLLDIWAYWDWFLIRQGVKGANNPAQRAFARGAISTSIPIIGLGSVLTIIFSTVGANIHGSNKAAIIWGVVAFLLIVSFAGSRRAKLKNEEFKHFDKSRIRRYDRYIWVITLSCVAAMVLMLIVLPSRNG